MFVDHLAASLRKRKGMRVVARAHDGRGALGLMWRTRPHVAVLDSFMPVLDGLGAARAIFRMKPDFPVVMLIADDNWRQALRARQAGVRGLVLKRDSLSILVKAIRDVFARKTFLSPSLSQPRSSGRVEPEAFARLSTRQRQVFRLVAAGKRNKEIAHELRLSVRTVEHHRAVLMRSLGMDSVAGLMLAAFRMGVIDELVAPQSPEAAFGRAEALALRSRSRASSPEGRVADHRGLKPR